MKMSSQINGQSAEIQQLVLPFGLNLSTNVNASLPPTAGALAYQHATTPQEVYIGDGNSWTSLKGASPDAFSYAALVNLTGAGGNPNLPNCSLYIQRIQSYFSQNMKLVTVVLVVDQSITTVATGDWSSLVGDIPLELRPPQTAYFPSAIGTATAIVNDVFSIQDDGQIVVHFGGTPGINTAFTTFSCTYRVA